jgi:hypothetical protein
MKRQEVREEAAKMPANGTKKSNEIFRKLPTIPTFVGPDNAQKQLEEQLASQRSGQAQHRYFRTQTVPKRTTYR